MDNLKIALPAYYSQFYVCRNWLYNIYSLTSSVNDEALLSISSLFDILANILSAALNTACSAGTKHPERKKNNYQHLAFTTNYK